MVTLSDLWPRFQGHGITEGEYLKTVHVSDKVSIEHYRKPYPVYRMVVLSMTFSDLWPRFQCHGIFRHCMVWYGIVELTSHSTQYRSFRRRGPWAVMYISRLVMEGQQRHNNPLNPRCFCLQRPKRDGTSS